jgi:CRISPR-associated protein Cas1
MKKSIYIFSSGEIKRKQNTIYFESKEGKKKFLPVENIREILIFGEASVNKKALEFFTMNEIILHFFNYYDYYIGSYYPREHYNSGYMILKQAEFYNDYTKRIELAKAFVKGASDNSFKNLRYYDSRGAKLSENMDKISSLSDSIEEVKTIDELMAVEGNIKDQYYKSFDFIIKNPDFLFEKRTKRPPRNYINSMVSFINSLVYTDVLSAIYRTHLDPRIGYLHTTNFRRFTLNLDVAEIFKPVIGDRLIFSLINRGIIKKSDFDTRSGGIRFKENTMKEIVRKYNEKMSTTIKVKNLKRKVSYRNLILLELYKIEKHLIGEKTYRGFVMEW